MPAPSATPSSWFSSRSARCLAAVGGWRYARASAPVNGPIILISIDTLRADHCRPTATGRSRRRRSTRSRPTASCSSAPTPMRRRRCRRTPRCCPDGCRSRPACATTSASSCKPASGCCRRCCATAASRPAASSRRSAAQGNRHRARVHVLRRRPPRCRRTTSPPNAWLDANGNGRGVPVPARRPLARSSDIRRARRRCRRRVGRLVRYLRSHQLYDRSTIIFVSDHGEGLGEHGEATHGRWSTRRRCACR